MIVSRNEQLMLPQRRCNTKINPGDFSVVDGVVLDLVGGQRLVVDEEDLVRVLPHLLVDGGEPAVGAGGQVVRVARVQPAMGVYVEALNSNVINIFIKVIANAAVVSKVQFRLLYSIM